MRLYVIIIIILAFVSVGCVSTEKPERFEIINSEEITQENLPVGSRIEVELDDGSVKEIEVLSIDERYIHSKSQDKVVKESVRFLTILSLGIFPGDPGKEPVVDFDEFTLSEFIGCIIGRLTAINPYCL